MTLRWREYLSYGRLILGIDRAWVIVDGGAVAVHNFSSIEGMESWNIRSLATGTSEHQTSCLHWREPSFIVEYEVNIPAIDVVKWLWGSPTTLSRLDWQVMNSSVEMWCLFLSGIPKFKSAKHPNIQQCPYERIQLCVLAIVISFGIRAWREQISIVTQNGNLHPYLESV